MLDVFDRLSALAQDEQRDLACRMAVITSPYGVVAPDVVEPPLFLELMRRLADVAEGRYDGTRVRQQCEDVFARFPHEEPTGGGFFAFGAVVEVAYAVEALTTAPDEGVKNCAKRFLDLLDAADDDGEHGCCDAGIAWLRQSAHEREQSLRRAVASHAQKLTPR